MSEQPHRNIPNTGTVEKIRLEWMVKEDGALAHHLQTQEFDDHFCGNRQRNGNAYKDYSLAKSEQFMEEKMYAKRASDQNMPFEQEEGKKIAEETATGGTKHVQIQCESTFGSENWPENELVGLHRMSISDANYLPQLKYSNSLQDIPGNFPKLGPSTVCIRHEKTTQTEPVAGNNINVSHYDIDVYDVHHHYLPVQEPSEQDSEQEDEDEKLAMKLQIQEVVDHDRLHHHQQCPPENKPEDDAVCQQEEDDAELAIRLQIQEVSTQEALERDRLLALRTQNEELSNLL